jgi:hemolysin activation/secretion protein
MNQNRTSLYCRFLLTHWLILLAIDVSTTSLAAQILPPLPAGSSTTNQLPTATSLFVRAFEFEGNHAFTDAELSEVTKRFTNRKVSGDDLEQARRNVSLYYISHGYINSGAIIPDQDPTNGVIMLRIVEGRLSGITLHGNKWLRDAYITNRIERWAKMPLNLNQLQGGLQLLRQNPNVGQINAELKPGTSPGESELDLKVADKQPFRVGLQFDNERPPSVGEYEVWVLASDLNLTGNGDPLDLKYGIMNSGRSGPEFSGADNLEGSYVLPLTRFDTTLAFDGSRLNTGIVEEPFTSLNISSLTASYGVVLRQPVYQTANQEAALSVGFNWRRNQTWLLGQPFGLSPGATTNGEMIVSVLTLSQEWLNRGQNNVLALRSTFNFGLDVLGATHNRVPGDPDANFFSWVGQGQYVQRLFKTQNQLILRVNGQWTDERLLAIQQLSVGGADSVRGYLENQLVRDRGIVSSVELRVPLLFNKAGAGIVQLAPFFDYGAAFNVGGSLKPTSVYSAGSGLLVSPNEHFSAALYWGYRLKHVGIPNDSGAQGDGITFKLTFGAL